MPAFMRGFNMGKALVVSGDAARGCFQGGVLSQLEARDFDAIYGTSSGAINAVLFSYLNFREIEAAWKGISGISDLYEFNWLACLWRAAIFNNTPIVERIERILKTHRPVLPVTVSTTNLRTGELRYWNNLDEEPEMFAQAVASSASLPGLCCSLHDEFMSDGSLRARIPIIQAVADGHTDITLLVADCYPDPYRTQALNFWPGAVASLWRTADIMFKAAQFEVVNAVLPQLDKLTVYAPEEPLKMSYLGFDPADIARNFHLGRLAEPLVILK